MPAKAQPDLPFPDTVGVNEMGIACAMNAREVRRYAKDGVMVKNGKGRIFFLPSLRNYIQNIRSRAASHVDNQGNSAVAENIALKNVHRQLAELKLKREAGELISVDEVKEAWEQLAIGTRQLFLSLPSRIAFDLPHLSAHDNEVIERNVRSALEEVAISGNPSIPGVRNDA